MALKISTKAFEYGKTIPAKYTCEGENVSPELHWNEVPNATVTLAMICEDPDAPGGTFTHWIIYNLSPNSSGLEQGVPLQKNLDNGAIQGSNDMNKYGYGGPCPPRGKPHRYYFKLFALNKQLAPESANTREEFFKAIDGKVIEEAEYMGVYKR